jgi:hypothetical protein
MNSDTITISIADSDDDLIYIPSAGSMADCVLPSIALSDCITGIGDFTFTTSTPEITLGSTSITEEKLNDLLTLLDMIESMPDNSGIKKLFNSHKAVKKLGPTE